MKTANTIKTTVKIAMPIIFGGLILYWMYRDFDFRGMRQLLIYDMDWSWMLLSFPFGILAQALRGMRWRQTLEPLGERPRTWVSINAVFLSYASSLVIPRIGEFARCGVLKRYDGVSFPKALGTVVTERAVDTLLLCIVIGASFIMQLRMYNTFFDKTGMRLDTILRGFSAAGYLVTAICGVAALMLIHMLLKRLSVYDKVKSTLGGIWQGVISLRSIVNVPTYILMTVGIWVCYFLHYYLTFFCFGFTEHLGVSCALVTFVVGSIAVIVPTPNGAGPWHFAVKTMLILYGVGEVDALYFVLIVHSVQTLLVALLGIWAWISLSFTKRTLSN